MRLSKACLSACASDARAIVGAAAAAAAASRPEQDTVRRRSRLAGSLAQTMKRVGASVEAAASAALPAKRNKRKTDSLAAIETAPPPLSRVTTQGHVPSFLAAQVPRVAASPRFA
eukprot:2878091-Pleurochrysis_carterae.AAC.2